FWGRELVVAIATKNSLLIGEKVHIKSAGRKLLSDFSARAHASASDDSKPFIRHKRIEASGLHLLDSNSKNKQLLVVSDETGPKGSPFWRLFLNDNTVLQNLPFASPIGAMDDFETLAKHGRFFYSM